LKFPASLLVAGLLVAGLGVVTPATANPFDGNCDLQGDGSSADPYMLFDESDVIEMDSCSVVGGTTHFELGNDIFMTAGIKNYARDAYFDKSRDVVLDGQGFGIHGFSVGDPDGVHIGLFGDVRDLVVRDLTLISGSVIGDIVVGVLVGEADSLDATNVVIVNDSLTCTEYCGLLAGRVLGPATMNNVTVLSATMTAGIDSGLLIGELRGTLIVDKVVASASYQFGSEEGALGGLIGRISVSDESDVGSSSITNVYIGLENIYSSPRSTGPIDLGGVIGDIYADSVDFPLVMEGLFVEMKLDGATYFGGLVGSILFKDDSDPSATKRTLSLSIDDVLVYGDVNTVATGGGISAGLLGYVDKVETKDEISLNVTDALVAIDHDAVAGTGGTDVFSFADFTAITDSNGQENVTMSNALLVSDMWDDSWGNLTKNTGTGISDISEDDLGDIDNIPFSNTVTNPGTLGTDDWEHCPGVYPYPTFTPNSCTNPVITMSANSISGTLSQAVTAITDTAPKGAGTSMLYTVEPSLPRGLHLNPVTGTISGTPVELRAARTYAIRKYNSVTNPMAQQFDNGTEAVSYFVIETTLPVTQQAQGSQPAQPAEPVAPTVYTGPILVKFSEQTIGSGQAALIAVSGERLDAITSISVDGVDVPFVLNDPASMLLSVPPLSSGSKTLMVKSANGVLQHQGAFTVLAPESSLGATSSAPTEQTVNVGSFNGKLVVYALNLDGAKISWKVAGRWGTAVADGNDLNRFDRPVGAAGVNVIVEIYVNGVRQLQKTVLTR
jgi:hypothetical protein